MRAPSFPLALTREARAGDMVLVQFLDAPQGTHSADQQWLQRGSERLRRALPDGAGHDTPPTLVPLIPETMTPPPTPSPY